ncbi:MAG TPA: acyltransferase, partial [Devosia sp.]|nr:acyltransferase [Devosia sp.]
LSGFLQARPYWQALNAGEPLPPPLSYALDRAARLIPAFWLALTVSFIAGLTIFGVVPDGGTWLRYMAGLLLVAPWHWSTLYPVEVNAPLWLIGFIAMSHALLAVGFWSIQAVTKRRGPGHDARILWVGVIASALAAHWLFVSLVGADPRQIGNAYGLQDGARSLAPWFNPFSFFAMFAIGVLAAGVRVQMGRKRGLRFDMIALLAITAAMGMIWNTGGRTNEAFYGWLQVPFEFPLFHLLIGTILAVMPSTYALGRLLDAQPIQFFSRIALGIYLWHYLVLEIVHFYWAPDFTLGGMTDPARYFTFCALVIAITIAIATLSRHFLEQPAINWASRREQRHRLVARVART